MKDLRHYIDQVQKVAAHEFLRVAHPIDPTFEMTTLLYKLEKMGLYPMTLFERPVTLKKDPSPIAVLSNMFATRAKIAIGLDLPPEKDKMDLSLEYVRRSRTLIPPVVVPASEAPVKEVVRAGAAVDLLDLPVVTHHEMDAGAYFTMPVVAKDPDNGVYNVSFQRMWVKGPRDTGISIAPRHMWNYYMRYERDNRPMPIAAVVGHHPAFSLGAMSSVPIETDEYEVIGGLLGEPLRLTASQTWGEEFLVPADAEIVVEGYVPPKVRKAEAPFGEFTGYYGSQKLNPVVEVTAVTYRRDAILQTIFLGHPDIDYLMGVTIEGDIYHAIRPYVPTVKAVHVPPSGKCYNVYIAIKKPFEGAGKLAALTAIPTHDFVKHVIVVDDDIDVFNEADVLFAVATRVQGDEDIEIIKGIRGNVLDPSARHVPMWTNVIIDATKPLSRPFEVRVNVPAAVEKRMRLEEYVSADALRALRGRS